MLRDKIIYFFILFLYVFESFNILGLSVFRSAILPLIILGITYLGNTSLKKKDFNLLIPIFIFLIWTLLSAINDGNIFNSITGIIGNLLVIFYLLKLFRKYGYNKDFELLTCIAFSLYALPYLFNYLFFYTGGRFTGIHRDPNFAGAFITLSIVGSNIILWILSNKGIVKKLYKLVLVLLIGINMYLILKTGSRGTFISSILLIFIINFYYGSILVKTASVIIVFFSISNFIYLMETVEWNDDLSGVELLAYRMNVVEESGDDFSRLKLFNDFVSVIDENSFSGMGLNTFMKRFGQFPHNLFLDILVEGGLIFGSLFIGNMLNHIRSYLIKAFKAKIVSVYFIIFISGFLVFLPLSAYGLKLFWIFISYLLIINNKYNESISNNTDS